MDLASRPYPDVLRSQLQECDEATNQAIKAIDVLIHDIYSLERQLRAPANAKPQIPPGVAVSATHVDVSADDMSHHLATIKQCRSVIAQGPASGQPFADALVTVCRAAAALQRGRGAGLPGISSSEVKAAEALKSQALLAAQNALQSSMATAPSHWTEGQRQLVARLAEVLVRTGQSKVLGDAFAAARGQALASSLDQAANAQADGPAGQRVSAMLRALGESARQESMVVVEAVGRDQAASALSSLVSPRVRELTTMLQTEVLSKPASLAKAADLVDVAATARSVVPALLETLHESPGAGMNGPVAAADASAGLTELQRSVLSSSFRTWRFLEQPGGPGPPDERSRFPPDATSNALVAAAALAVRRLSRVPELTELVLERPAQQGPSLAGRPVTQGRLQASVASVLDGVLASMELGARKAYPKNSGLAELHVLNSAAAMQAELQRTEPAAALAAVWLSNHEARAALWADAYLTAAWSQALRGMREDAAQQPRGSSLLPEAQRAVVKTVWTACNDAIYTAQTHPAVVEDPELRARLQAQLSAGFLAAYRQFVAKYEAGQYTKGKRSKYERYSVADVEALVGTLLTGQSVVALPAPDRKGSVAERFARFRTSTKKMGAK